SSRTIRHGCKRNRTTSGEACLNSSGRRRRVNLANYVCYSFSTVNLEVHTIDAERTSGHGCCGASKGCRSNYSLLSRCGHIKGDSRIGVERRTVKGTAKRNGLYKVG